VHVTWGVVLLGLKFGFDFGDLLGLGFSLSLFGLLGHF
jgi:hypothetical protein